MLSFVTINVLRPDTRNVCIVSLPVKLMERAINSVPSEKNVVEKYYKNTLFFALVKYTFHRLWRLIKTVYLLFAIISGKTKSGEFTFRTSTRAADENISDGTTIAKFALREMRSRDRTLRARLSPFLLTGALLTETGIKSNKKIRSATFSAKRTDGITECPSLGQQIRSLERVTGKS